MRRRPKKTIHRDERKFAEVKPADGEDILFRLSGYRSYVRGTWDEASQEVLNGPSGLQADGLVTDGQRIRISVRYLKGWLPIRYANADQK